MNPLSLSAYTLVSATGSGLEKTAQALKDERSGLRRCDLSWAPLDTYIGRVDGIETTPIASGLEAFECRNNRLAQMGLQADGFADAARAAAERYGAGRVAVILGSSTSGIRESELAFANRESDGSLPETFRYDTTHDFYSLAEFVRVYLGLNGPTMTVSTACSSSAKTFVDAAQVIDAGLCDAAVVGGVDSLCLLTLRGFGALELTSPEPCRPNDANRNGISIGEAAGFALLERKDRIADDGIALLGFGESCDAYHMSSPHPEGLGAAQAMQQALDIGGLKTGDIDYINLHGTGSQINDTAEDAAVFGMFGDAIPCSSTKGWTGHVLGAAGITEAVIACLCIRDGFLPTNLNMQTRDPDLSSQILSQSREAKVDRVLSNSFGFGGNNCSLILGRAP